MSGLTGPQEQLLYELNHWPGVFGMYLSQGYKPAQKLVALKLAEWNEHSCIRITEAGRAALSHPSPQP